MEHGASSPGSSRNVVRTHLGGPLDCSVYKVMFFNKFSGLLCPGPWFGNKIFFNKHDKRVNYPLPQPPQIVWIELNWIQSNDFCHEASNDVQILGGNIFFLSVACSEVEHDCVHKSPPSTPPCLFKDLNVSLMPGASFWADCVLYSPPPIAYITLREKQEHRIVTLRMGFELNLCCH